MERRSPDPASLIFADCSWVEVREGLGLATLPRLVCDTAALRWELAGSGDRRSEELTEAVLGAPYLNALVTGRPQKDSGIGTFRSQSAVAAVSYWMTGAVMLKFFFTPLP